MGATCSNCSDCTPCGGDEREIECNTDYMKEMVSSKVELKSEFKTHSNSPKYTKNYFNNLNLSSIIV